MNKTVLCVLVTGFFGALTLHTGCIGSSGGGSDDDDDGNGGKGACVPDVDEPDDLETDPECEQCVRRNCDLDDGDCSDPCEDYYACTCDCDEDDEDCFSDCLDEKSSSCSSCEEDAGEELLSCVEDECADECLDGGSIGDTGDDDSDDSDSDDSDDSGSDGGSTTGDGDGDGGDSGGGDSGGGGTGGGGDVCEELQECCAGLDATDQQFCDLATDEFSCQLWLEIFQDEGKC